MIRHLLHYPALLLVSYWLTLPGIVHGQATEIVLHHFAGPIDDGSYSSATLIEGPDGNFYGTTRHGGVFDIGTIFQMSPTGTVTIMHSFRGHSFGDGTNPYAGLIQAADGNFYGTTRTGGSTLGEAGTVFKMTPTGTYTILYSFGSEVPEAALVQGLDGDLYGTTTSGGTTHNGTIFKITPSGTLTILHSFLDGSVPNDGSHPESALIQASDGNFYGVTPTGGSVGGGTAFKMTPSGSVTILHDFLNNSTEGLSPRGGLVRAMDGNFYGVTNGGGTGAPSIYGTVFRMTPSGTVTILHWFDDGSVANDGRHPAAALVQAADGNFYGTTSQGGSLNNGTVFAMTPTGSVTIMHSFDGRGSDDVGGPYSTVVQSSDGYLYGTTLADSIDNLGIVYRVAVPSIMDAVNRPSTDSPALPTWGLLGLGLLLVLAAARSLPRKKVA